MSDIYKLINPENGEEQLLVSKEYVDLRIRALKEALSKHIQNIDDAHTNKTDDTIRSSALLDNAELKDLVFKEENQNIPAENIITDATHKFITQNQLESFKSRPTAHEVEALINNNYNSIKNTFNEMYSRLLNMPDAVKKLKDLSIALDNDASVKAFIKSLESKVEIKEFDEHVASYLHLNNADRTALNILLKLIEEGTIDKIKEISLDYCDESYNSTKLDGKTFDQVRSRGAYNKIYSILAFNEYKADIYFPEGCDLSEYIYKEEIDKMIGKVSFLPSKYTMSEWNIIRDNSLQKLIIEGCGDSTLFKILGSCILNNVEFRDCSINDTTNMIINRYVTFNDVVFNNCNIILNGSIDNRFINCKFNKCIITFKGACSYNRFADCFFDRTKLPKYAGNTNVISNPLVSN